jgi:tetratricopeptide (TPR) repeat protein
VFTRLSEAYRILSDLERRATYEAALGAAGHRSPSASGRPEPAPPRPPAVVVPSVAAPPPPAPLAPNAEDALRAAEEAYEAGRHWEAIPILERMLVDARGVARRKGRVLLANCHLKNAEGRASAEQELIKAIKEDAANAEAYFLLGRIYRDGGLPIRAAAMFRKTLELKPRHAGAAAELGSLPSDEPPREPGLLKKLFR